MNNECFLMDLERTISSGLATYWKSNERGYTNDLKQAGLYPEKEANRISGEDFDKRTVVISRHVVDNID